MQFWDEHQENHDVLMRELEHSNRAVLNLSHKRVESGHEGRAFMRRVGSRSREVLDAARANPPSTSPFDKAGDAIAGLCGAVAAVHLPRSAASRTVLPLFHLDTLPASIIRTRRLTREAFFAVTIRLLSCRAGVFWPSCMAIQPLV